MTQPQVTDDAQNVDAHAALLSDVQRRAFAYFMHETNLANGLVRDTNAPNAPSSIAAVGLALTSYPVAIERGFISRAHAAARTLVTLRFFHQSKQGPEADATGYKGFYYHFLDMSTGARTWHSELSTIDSALLVAGMLAAATYFEQDNDVERTIRELADELYARMDWRWAQNGAATVTMGWTPEHGFLPYRWEGYDEAMLLYVMALGSPTFPIGPESYTAWANSYEWRSEYDISYLHAGPLFTHQLSHLWLDFRGIQDAFMRQHACDYFENSRRATLVQHEYARRNPSGFAGYGESGWGITATDGPGECVREVDGVARQFYGYEARGVPDGPDDGTIAPWGMITSLPFAPELVLPALLYMKRHGLDNGHEYGFWRSYNPTFPDADGRTNWWKSPYHCGLNQGPIVAMIENHRTNMIWRLMRACPPIAKGLRAAGFTGGWLGS
jgi:hypothetical protein